MTVFAMICGLSFPKPAEFTSQTNIIFVMTRFNKILPSAFRFCEVSLPPLLTKALNSFFIAIQAKYMVHFILLDPITLILCYLESTKWSSSLCYFLQPTAIYRLVVPNYFCMLKVISSRCSCLTTFVRVSFPLSLQFPH